MPLMPLEQNQQSLTSQLLLLEYEKALAAAHGTLRSLRDEHRLGGRHAAAEQLEAAMDHVGAALLRLNDY